MTPIQLTLLGMLIGIAGGALLYGERLGFLAFALLIIYGIIDSADGQLARMTGQVTELGRVLDGVSGYRHARRRSTSRLRRASSSAAEAVPFLFGRRWRR